MLQYPNYSMNSYPQYQQYPPGYQQQINPYMDQLNQLRNMQQPVQPIPNQIQPPGLYGRMVEDFSVVTANDVPMDGNGAIFVKRDGSEIQVRNWNANGTIATIVFKPVIEEQADNLPSESQNVAIRLSDDVMDMFQSSFAGIYERLDKMEKVIKPSTKRKETGTDE